jgi:hypothetical protein
VLSAQQGAPPAKAGANPSASAAVTPRPWPRTFNEDGTQVVIHQPQLESWVGTALKARAAVSVKTGVKTDKDGKPHDVLTYGVVWFTARTDTDKVARRVTLSNITVDKVVFPTDKDHEAKYTDALKRIASHGGQVVDLDLLEAALAINREVSAGGATIVNNDPPEILFSFEPALLVLIDGNPSLKPSGVPGVERVVNTRSLLLKRDNQYYVSFANRWVTAPAIAGPWKPADKVADALEQAKTKAVQAKLVDVLAEPEGELKKTIDSGKLPKLLVSSKPAELIMVNGDPEFADIPGTQLAYVANTGSDVFVDRSHDNAWYVLISGRWFTAASSNGPWTFVDGKSLPADFMKIPPDSEKSAVLASIPGTPEARESLIANSIPQTAAVDRGKATLKVDYDGAPQFKPIDGTSLNFAWNTAVPVIQVNPTAYYAVDNGVWFAAPSATGPWSVAYDVPSVIYSIPPTSPLHYVTYVRVYSYTDNQVYVGYTPGYYGTVVTNGVVVYGTGYPCSPWIGSYWYGCPATYGMGVAFGYDPWVGWTFGYAWGWAWASAWYGPWWGPWGYYGGYWGGGIATANISGRWGNSVVAGVGAAWANPWTGNYGRGVRGGYYNEATGGRGVGYAARNTNIYTGTRSAAAGGMRYNPQTGRAVAGAGAAAANPYTGNAAAAGARTTVNTNTGRVNQTAGVAGRTDTGAGSAGAFNTKGAGGDASGAGYVHYDKATGDVSRGGVANINDQMYAGKDGNIYKYDQGSGWSQIDASGAANRISSLPSDSGLDNDRLARDRDADRYASWGSNAGDRMAAQGYDRGGGAGGGYDRGGGGFRGAYDPYGDRAFDRGNYDSRFSGNMGGRRFGNSGGSFGAGGGFRRR